MQALGARHVEISLVYRSHLDQRRKVAEHFMHLGGILAIALGMAIHKNRLRTEFRRGAQRHGRVHAKLARRVGGCRDHAALVALPAHYYRLAFQRWVKQFLHGDEEGVHIDVEDGAWGGAHRSAGRLHKVYRESARAKFPCRRAP
jgi:hypothetical protein